MSDLLRINDYVWASALAKMPFKDFKMIVLDIQGKIWSETMKDREEKRREEDNPFWEIYDLLHAALKSKWSFKENNTENVSSEEINNVAHKLNIEYLRWHPDKWPQFENNPEYKKEIGVMKREKQRKRTRP